MPGAPLNAPPLILLSGDCTGSAYIFAPTDMLPANAINTANVSTDAVSDGAPAASTTDSTISPDPGPRSSSSVPPYEMVFEIQCGATVGSAAVAAALDGSVGNHNNNNNTH